jgi:hypothetical protein
MFEHYSCKDLALIAVFYKRTLSNRKESVFLIHNILIERKREEEYLRVFSKLMNDVTKFRLAL